MASGVIWRSGYPYGHVTGIHYVIKYLFNVEVGFNCNFCVYALQLKSEFDKLFEDLKEDDKTHEMEGAEVFVLLKKSYIGF